MKLSNHFTLAEAIKSDTARRLNINNQPSPEIIKKLELVAKNILEPIREYFKTPFTPTSWYRCKKLNRALKSKDTSQHVKGEAVDIIIPGIECELLYNYIKDHLEYDQLIIETRGSTGTKWVHVSYKHRGNRKQALKVWV